MNNVFFNKCSLAKYKRSMNDFFFKILFSIFLLLNCQAHSYRLHYGKSYFNSNSPIFFNNNANEKSRVEISGVFFDKNLLSDKYPLLLKFNQADGLIEIPLNQKLNYENNTIIKLSGRFIDQSEKYPNIREPIISSIFAVEESIQISGTEFFQKNVAKEYEKIMAKLQKKITPKESKLKLKPNSDWKFYFDETTNKLLAVSRQYDLMYAAEIEFLIDTKTQKIIDIFAYEYFKGEI